MTHDQHGPPIKVKGRAPQAQPSTNSISSAKPSVIGRDWYRRRAPAPWRYEPPGARGYEDAAHHLLGHGLTPAPNRAGLEAMWRRGGHSRRAAEFIAERWDLAS